MPLERCTKDGRSGWKWGAQGTCFTGDTGRRRAIAQAIAIEGPEEFARIQRGDKAIEDILTDEAFWEEQRAKITRIVMPVFREAFMVGATLGAEQRPARAKAVGLRQQLPFDFEGVAAASDEVLASFTDQWWQQFRRSTQNALRASIVRAQENGLGVEAVIKDIEPLFGPQRARLIAVSETTTLVGQGAQATYARAGFPQYEWRTVRDARVDPICEALDGQIFPISQKFERAHPGCVVGETLVRPMGRAVAATERAYEGDLIVISTTSGKHLTCTPNHPIFTQSGWVAAHLLDVGGDVISSERCEGLAAAFDLDDQQMPARIEDVARALREASEVPAVPVPLSPEDFHGDGVGSKVAVISTDGSLRIGIDAPFGQHLGESRLIRGDTALSLLPRDGYFDSLLLGVAAAPNRVMSRSRLPLPLALGHLAPLQEFGVAVATPRYVETFEPSADGPAVDVQSFGDGVLGLTTEVRTDDLMLDEIIGVERRWQVSTHVYNIQTEGGWYYANGIVTHNCRCFPVPAGEPQAAAALAVA